MVIMGIDPSFKHLAFSLYDGNEDIYIDLSSYDLGQNVGFEKVFNASISLWEQFKLRLDAIGVGRSIFIDKVISEVPPPVGQFSAGLFALDVYILKSLFSEYRSISEIYVVPASYLSMVHGTSKYKKSDSTALANYFINEVFDGRYNIKIPDVVSSNGRKLKGRLNNDRAESFLFLLRMMCKYNIDGYGDRIMSEMSGLGNNSEKLLISR